MSDETQLNEAPAEPQAPQTPLEAPTTLFDEIINKIKTEHKYTTLDDLNKQSDDFKAYVDNQYQKIIDLLAKTPIQKEPIQPKEKPVVDKNEVNYEEILKSIVNYHKGEK